MSEEFWESAAQRDPLWAILSDPTKKGRRWTTREFFETGRREISLLMYQLQQLGHAPVLGQALDFGCGVGRLSQALGAFFPQVIAVDVAPTMIRLAEQANRLPDRVRYVLNRSDDLRIFPSGTFDFIYSDIVLQHLEPPAAQRFIAEFLRVLKKGGVTVFQLPSHRRALSEASNPSAAMSDAAYNAQLSLVTHPPRSMRPGQVGQVILRIENTSGIAWDQSANGPIRLGNHWLSTSGEMLIQDDGRTLLGALIDPGSEARATVEIHAPADPGQYICEFDLVHEGITWFGDRGSRTLRQTLAVTSELDAAVDREEASPAPLPAPNATQDYTDVELALPDVITTEIVDFPMHGINRDLVLERIARLGGQAFHIEPDERGGPEWIGFRYYVKRLN